MTSTKKIKKARKVFLAFTTNETLRWVPELLKIYSKSSYQDAYNWIADIVERHGNALQPLGLKYPTVGKGKIVSETVNPENGQRWWLEVHEVC